MRHLHLITRRPQLAQIESPLVKLTDMKVEIINDKAQALS